MKHMSEVKFMISEAAKQLQVEAHVLRYWEEELGLHIDRTEMGHRYYTEDDIQLFRCIQKLKNEGILLRELKPLIPELTTLKRQKAAQKNNSKAIPEPAPSRSPEMIPSAVPEMIPSAEPEIPPAAPENVPSAVPETIPAPMPEIPSAKPEMVPPVAPNDVPTSTLEKAALSAAQVVTQTTTAEVIEVTRLEQVRSLFGEAINEALVSNNHTLEKNITRRVTSNVCREIGLLFQVQEQQEEEHYRKLDCLIRQQQMHRKETAENAPAGALKRLFT